MKEILLQIFFLLPMSLVDINNNDPEPNVLFTDIEDLNVQMKENPTSLDFF